MPLKRLARVLSAAILLAGLVIRPIPGAAQNGSLAGELFLAKAAGTGQIAASVTCPSDQSQPARIDFTVSGTASGPYPGTFVETGAVQLAYSPTDLRPLVWFSARFTISSPNGQVAGSQTMALEPLSEEWWANQGKCSSTAVLTSAFFEADGKYEAQIQTATGTAADQGRSPLGLKFQTPNPRANLFGALFRPPHPPPPANKGYHVSGNQILDSTQHRFVIRGDDTLYGRFAGGDANGYGLRNYQNRVRDIDDLRSMQVNLIRISVSWDAAHLPATDPNYVPFTEYMAELDSTVALVTARGMVAVVSDGMTRSSTDKRNFAGDLAARYRTNPLVWIKPDNEPNCESGDGDPTLCTDWANWQTEETSYVQAIRAAGNTQPIVINCVGWSWDCSLIASHPLGDTNLIYGAHRYGKGATNFDTPQQAASDLLWANLASTFPMIVDEVGLYNGSSSPVAWGAGFLDYATNWVLHRQGGGVIGFADAWSDSNSMTNAADGSWNDWGLAFITHYLRKVSPAQDQEDDDRALSGGA